MKMECRALVSKLIVNVDNDLIANCCSHDGKWPLSVDTAVEEREVSTDY